MKILFEEFFDCSIFCCSVYFCFVEKVCINIAGKKVEIFFALVLYTEIKLFCSAFENKQKKFCTAMFLLTVIDCVAEKRLM